MSCLAERNVIGSLLMNPESMEKAYGKLEPEMFTSEVLGKAYTEILRGYENGYPVNLVILDEKMRGTGLPKDTVLQELKECVAETVSSFEIETCADIMIRNYRARMFDRIINMAKAVPDSVDIQIGKMIHDLEALIEDKGRPSKTLAEIAKENKGMYFCENKEEKMHLGFPKLDDILGGLEGGDMIVIGARPAVGKSAFVTQIAKNLANQGKKVGFYNLEMQEKQVYERFVVAQSGIGLTRLRRASRFLGDEEERFRKANEALEKRDNIVIITGSKLVSEIRSESRHMGYDVIIIDYLQLLRSDKSYKGNRYAEVGAISKAIKALAMELNIPIIALSQLNRTSEIRENKEPTMSELREAGDIEQDASVIMLLWNLSKTDRSGKGIKVEKQRQGNTGEIALNFNGDLMRFEELQEPLSEVKKWEVKEEYDDVPFD